MRLPPEIYIFRHQNQNPYNYSFRQKLNKQNRLESVVIVQGQEENKKFSEQGLRTSYRLPELSKVPIKSKTCAYNTTDKMYLKTSWMN